MSDRTSSSDSELGTPVQLAQANTASGNRSAGSPAGDAARAAQAAFTESLSSGKSAQDAIALAVQEARKEALARGLSPAQADALALQVREELGARLAALQGGEQAGVSVAGSTAIAQAAGAVASPQDQAVATGGNTSASAAAGPASPVNALAAVETVLVPQPAAGPAQGTVIADGMAGGPSVVDAGGGMGSSSLGSLSRSIGTQVGVDSAGSVNVTGMIAPYIEQRIASGGGLVTPLVDRLDVRGTSAAGGDPTTVQARLDQIASIKAAASQVGGGSVNLPVGDSRPPLEPAAAPSMAQPSPIRVAPFLNIEPLEATVPEGHSGFIELRYRVTRTGDLSEVDRVTWNVAGLNGADLLLEGAVQGGQLVFQPRVDSIEIVVRIASNRVVEADRAISITLSQPINARLGTTTEATTLVVNDDSQYEAVLGPDQASVVEEGSGGPGRVVVFAVNRSGNLEQASWVDYSAGVQSQTNASDFLGSAIPQGRVSFAPGQTQVLVTLVLAADQSVEGDEALVLSLTASDYPALITRASATVMIENDDVRFDIARAPGQPAAVLEGTGDATPMVFEVTMEGAVNSPRTVRVTTNGLSANDFLGDELPNLTLTFAPGQVSQRVTLMVKADSVLEADETLVVSLADESNAATVGSRNATVTLLNDDVRFDVVRAPGQAAQVLEGTGGSGQTAVVFEVTKTGDVSTDRTVKLTAGGLSAQDFVGGQFPEVVLTFAPNQTSKLVTILVNADATVEANEALVVTLGEESAGASVGAREATVTIENDDVSWAVQRQAATVLEGTSVGGSTPVVFTVTKTGAVNSARTVDFAVTGMSANDFALGQIPSGTLTFAAGETSRQVTILVAQDDLSGEGDETLTFSLSNPSNGATVTTASASTLVYNDDLTVSVTPVEAQVLETDTGEQTRLVFRITRSEGLNARSVDWTLALAGIAPEDLVTDQPLSGTVDFAPGQTEVFITVALRGNDAVRTAAQAPQATLTLSNPTNGMQLGQASQVITVVDNDVYFSIAANQASVTEGYAGQVPGEQMVFTVTRDSAGSGSDTVQWRVAPSSDVNAADFAAGQDLLANGGLPSGTVTFTGDQRTATITLTLAGDDWFGANETVLVSLSNPSRGKVTVAEASSVVLNDDAPYSVEVVGSTSQFEGSDADSAATFVFRISRPANSALEARELLWSVQAAGTLDPAASSDDFAPGATQLPSGLVSFAQGATFVDVTLTINPDSRVEGSEYFRLAIADTAETRNTTIAVPLSQAVEIKDDDAAYRIDAVDAIFLEGSEDGSTQAFVFEVRRDGYLNRPATVKWDVQAVPQQASADPADFAGNQTTNGLGFPAGELVFTAGQATARLTVLVAADADYEPNEFFQVAISAANEAGMSFTQRTAQGLIFNDEIGLSVTAVTSVLPEGDVQGALLVFAVERQGVTQAASSVDWRVVANDATALTGDDFVAGQNGLDGTTLPSGTIHFSAGEATRLITLQVAADTVMEGHEGFQFQIFNASRGSQILTASQAGTITNDDSQIHLDPDTTPSTVDEGNGGTQPLVLRVLRDGSTVGTDTVAWTVTPSGSQPADLGADLSGATSGTLTFANGSSVALLTLNLVADGVLEPEETFTLTLGATSLGAVLKPGGLVSQDITITNDDSEVSFTPVTDRVSEGSPGQGGALVYEITRTGALREGTVNYAVTAGSQPGVAGNDFAGAALPSGTVSFAQAQISYLLTIAVEGDYSNELDENLTVSLTSAGPGQTLVGTTSYSGVIVNDDTGLSVAASQSQQVEGSTPGGLVAHEFTVTRSGIVTGETRFKYEVLGFGGAGLAVDALDFVDGVLPSGELTFTPGQTSMVITVWTVQDLEVENNEGLRLRLFDASGNADIQQGTADVQLLSDDSGLAITANSAEVNEGSQASQAVTFTVTRTGDLSKVSTANWTLSGGLDAADLTAGAATTGTVTFAINASSAVIVIPVKGDTTLETDELMTVTLSQASAGTVILPGQGSASTVVRNDDDLLTLVATSLTASEGALGTSTPLKFTVTRDPAGALRDGTVVEWTLNSSMIRPNDFELVDGQSQDLLGGNGGLPSGAITFAAGQTAVEVTVLVRGDAAVERDETFSISVSTATPNTEFTNTTVNGVVLNDDFGFSVEAVTPAVAEGRTLVNGTATGSGNDLVFSITRAGATDQVATVKWSLSPAAGLTADDLVNPLGGTTEVTFSVGETIKLITIAVQGDTTVEPDEALVMTISDARNVTQNTAANIVDATATVTVLNDDQIFEARVAGAGTTATVQEGGASTTVPLVFQVLRTGASSGSAEVPYSVIGGAGVTPDDYIGTLPSGILSFTAGQTSQTVTVIVKGDRIGEADEPYTLTLGTPSTGGVSNASATIIVANDDTNYVLAPVTDVLEGTGAGPNNYTFTIHRQGKLDTVGTVDWTVTARTGDALTAGDFVSASALPSGRATFAPNQSSVVVTLAINRDSNLEADEGMVITLTNPSQGTLEPDTLTQATAVILSDDDQFSIARATGQAASLFEGNSGNTPIVFTVTRTGALRGERVVTYTASGVGITADDFDGTPMSAGVTFAEGQSSANITFLLKGESVYEDQETLVVTLSNPNGGATLVTSATQAQVVIDNDDARLSVVATNPVIDEGSTVNGVPQPRNAVFTITRNGYEYQNSVFSYSVSGVTADDFFNNQLPAGTLTFTNGQITPMALTLVLKADSVKELDENLVLHLTNPSLGTEISTTAGTATQTILNDDSEFNITLGTVSRSEGDGLWTMSAANRFEYTVARSGAVNSIASVNWSATGVGTVASTGDLFVNADTFYTMGTMSTLHFSAGQTAATFTLYAYGDTGRGSTEADESFAVTLSGASDGSSVGAVGSFTSTILNDDTAVTLSPGTIRLAEAIQGQTTSYVYTATRSGRLDVTSVISYQVAGHTVYEQNRWEAAADAADFVGSAFPSGSLTFAPGETVKQFTIVVNGDDTVEDDQWFRVNVTAVQNVDQVNGGFEDGNNGGVFGEIARDEAIFTITDAPITGASVFEGDSEVDGASAPANLAIVGGFRAHVFQVNRTLSTNGNAWADWVVGTGVSGYDNADADDFKDDVFPSGRVTFTDGQSVGFITIWTKADDVGEFDEAFRVYFTSVSSGSSFDANDGSGFTNNRVILLNDDTRFDIVGSSPVVEGNSFVLRITRAGDQRGTDVAQWAVNFSGTETTNESTATTASWYRLDPDDIGANATAIQAAVAGEGMNVLYDAPNKRLVGEVLFLDGETTKTITITTIDDNLTETWREEFPTSIFSTNTRNVTGSVFRLTGTFAAGETVSATVDGALVSYVVTAADVAGGGSTSADYRRILDGLANAINTDATAAALATARPYTLVSGPALLIEDDSPFATASFVVTGSDDSTLGSTQVVAEVRPDRETATPGYTGVQWVLDNEPDLVTVATSIASGFEQTGGTPRQVVFTLTRANNPAPGELNYAASVAWRLDAPGVVWDVGTPTGTGTTVTYLKPDYQSNTIYGVTAFTAGQTTALVTVSVNADADIEDDESLMFKLVDAQTAYTHTIREQNGTQFTDVFAWGTERDKYGALNVNTTDPNSQATFTVLADDIRILFHGDESWFLKRFESTVSPVVNFTRHGVLDTEVVVSYAAIAGQAVAADFGVGASGFLTFAARTSSFGSSVYTFTLTNFFNDDELPEGNETFTLRLTAPADVPGSHVRLAWLDQPWHTYQTFNINNSEILDDDPSFAWNVVDVPAAEGNNGANLTNPFIFRLSRSTGFMGAATVTWSLAPDSIATTDDFLGSTTGTLFFNVDQTERFVTLSVRQDLVLEPNENFALRLTGATLTAAGTSISKVYTLDSPTVTIVNDDTGLSISNASVTEVDEGATADMVFTITRTGSINETSVVSWQATTPGGVGFAGLTDFIAASGTVTFTANQSTATITVVTRGDNEPEADEKFRVQIVSATNVEDTSYLNNPGTGTILNDDSAFSIEANQPQGALESAPHTFTITRTHSTAQNQVIGWQLVATTTGDDASASDFTGGFVGGNVTFSPGVLSLVITVPVINDANFEFDESYQVNLTLGAGATTDTLTVASAQGKILNDDTAFGLTVNQASRSEGEGPIVFTVNRVGDLSGTSTVQFTLTPGSGFNSQDYTGALPPNQVLTFAPNVSVQSFTIQVSDDNLLESDETLTATLSAASGAGLISSQTAATATVRNDDALFTLSRVSGDLDAEEGSGASRDVVLRVMRTGYTESSGSVDYAITPVSATNAAADFVTDLTGTLLFAAGETQREFTITIAGDATLEDDETFTVSLSTSSANFAVNTGSAQTLVLRNDDTRFDLAAVGSTTVTEADPSSVPANVPVVFRVDRSGRLSQEQVVTWTVEGTGADPASAADFVATTGTVTFAANAVGPQLITVYVKGDLEGEADEGFKVTISGDGLQFGTSSVTGQIIDDEASFSVRRHVQNGQTMADPFEGQSGAVTVVFDVIRSGNVATATSTVEWNLSGDVDADDFAAGQLPSGSLTFGPGETLQTVTVVIRGDTTVEPDEKLVLTLSNPSADADVVSARSQATFTILSDETSWALEAVSTPTAESDTSSGHVYRVVRTGSLYATTIGYSVAGVGVNAADGSDFVGGVLPSGLVSFAQGQATSAPFTVQVAGDSVLEPNEHFTVTLAPPAGDGQQRVELFATQTLTATIVNDDDVIGIAALSTTATEGDVGGTPVTFTLTREGDLSGVSTMGWRVRNAAAPAEAGPDDFVLGSGTVTFADGQSELTLTLQVQGDLDVEEDESFVVELYNPGAGSGIKVGAESASGTIANNDIDLRVVGVTAQAHEGDTVAGVMTFRVERTGLLTGTTTVDFAVTGVGPQAANAADFEGGVLPAGTLTFGPGETVAMITVVTRPDGDFEASESFQVLLSNPSGNAQVEVAAVTGQIINDDDQLEVVPHDATVAEGTDTQAQTYTDFVFRVDRTGSAIGNASATWTVTPGPGRALSMSEVQQSTGTVTFTDGQSQAFITVGVLADAVGEYNENFLVSLSNPSFGSTLIGSSAQGTVLNDDPVLSITANQPSLLEGNTGGPETPFVFTVTRTGNTSGASTARWQVSGVTSGESVDPVDFGGYMPSGMVVFTAGQVTQTLTVMVLADRTGELDEGFIVTLSEPTGADLLDERVATMVILNDDTLVSIQRTAATVAEGAAGSTTPTYFVVTREGDLSEVSTVQWRVEGVGQAQVIPEDFATADALGNGGLPSGTVTFSAGQATATVLIQVDGDGQYAPDETFRVTLSQPSGGVGIRTASATMTIVNDDALISIDTTPKLGSEGGSLEFAVTRTGTGLALSSQVVVGWAVSGYGENAASAADFAAVNGLVTFAAGQTAAVVTLQLLADSLVERDEQFRIQLTQVPTGNASFNPIAYVAQGAITDDDVGVWVTARQSQVVEGSQVGGVTPFVVEVHRTGRTDQQTVLNLNVSGSGLSPTSGDDFVGTSLAVTFAAGSTSSQLVTLGIVHDATSESNETFVVAISQGGGYTVIGEPVYGTIVNDDGTPSADVIYGSSGNDLLRGEMGNDVLYGNGGNDVFLFDAPNEGVDTIMDFSAGDRVSYKASAFGGLNISEVQDVSGSLDQILAALAASNTNPDFLRINVTGEFQFSTGAAGHLDELEAAITAGQATGPGFVAVGDASGRVHLYFDANLGSGTDGTGLQEIAVLNGLDDAHQLQLQTHTG